MVREDSEFDKIFTSREHIFADGMNVWNLQRDLGMLIFWNSKQKGYDLDDLIQLVETSNRQKWRYEGKRAKCESGVEVR